MTSNKFLLAATLLVMAAAPLSAQTIGTFTVGSAAVTPGGYVSLYAKNVAANGGSIAGVRFYREANGTGGLQNGGDAYVGMGVFANGMWTFAAPTTGLSGTQTFYAVAYDTSGNASAVASVTASASGSGFGNWSTLEPFLANMPLSIGDVLSTSVINFGTTVYTGPLDTTITLDRIRGDNGPNRSGDGAAFSNNGNPPLPTNRGNFYEFTINPQTGCTPNFTSGQIAFPGPLRFMIDTSGDIYFTGDHYATDLNLYIAGTPSVGSVAASPSSATAGMAVTLTAANVSETISPAPSPNANTGGNVLAAVSNVQFFLETNGVSGLQTDTDRVLGCGTQNGSTWTLTNVSTAGLIAGTYTVYAVGVDPAGNTATQTTALTITSGNSNQAPSVASGSASGITTNGATLNGSVNPHNQSTTAQFLYGLTTNYNFSVPVVGSLTGGTAQAVNAAITGLTPATTYHFTITATNNSGSVTGSDITFTTASTGAVPLGETNYSGILAAWETTGLANFGPSPFAAASNAPNVTVVGLMRGSGVGTTATAAGNAWGGSGFVFASAAAAVTGNSFVTFSVSNTAPGTSSFTNLAAYNIRRSGTGATTGLWQYQVGNGAFTDIGTAITWGSTTSGTGNPQSAIDLSGISALQNVGTGTNVTFRLVLWGGSGTGTWYVNNTTGYDLQVLGRLTALAGGNTVPSFTAPPAGTNLTGNAGVNFTVNCPATDADVPAQTLTYTLLAGPTNATVQAGRGTFNWRPAVAQADSTNPVQIVVTDSGTPNLSATNYFTVTVNPLPPTTALPVFIGGSGLFQCTITGPAGPDYAIQTATNLAGPWTLLLATNAPLMPFTFTDPNPTPPQKFYRFTPGP